MEIIRKYENRKLYSTTLSKYVKLDYILDLVRTRSKFAVVENKTNKDITKSIIMKSMMSMDVSEESLKVFIRGQK